ncbi:MAG: bifunctional oligoribonuclease/PAP phosphatase NrnA, partial [Phycisphaerae bacterium]|nr:bifunctional oligoribonuclease/PAP phosphatase NrnA [Phycisphaerae bacterium]
ETAILLVENPENVRVSLRSRDALDVAAIAAKFGGGGHKRAAGARIADDIDVVKDKLIHICSRALAQAD